MNRRGGIAGAALLFVSASVAPLRAQLGHASGKRLPTGVSVDPVGASITVGSMPLSMALAPEGQYAVVSLGGWREQGIQVVDLRAQRVSQSLPQESAFFGLAFSHDGRWLYSSGGNEDCIVRYRWNGNAATLDSTVSLAPKEPKQPGSRYPAGLAVSQDDRFLYVAENISDTMAVVDLIENKVVQRVPTQHYPYAIVLSGDGTIYVSAWGGEAVSVFHRQPDGHLSADGTIAVGRHPSALLLDDDGARLFVALASKDEVAVVNTHSREVIARLSDAAPAGPAEGVTPNALALSNDRKRLFVAEADSNAVAVFALDNVTQSKGVGKPIGRIPADWYPTAVASDGKRLLTLCGKGHGSGPNLNGPKADRKIEDRSGYTLGQLNGTLLNVDLPSQLTSTSLSSLTARVVAANHWRNAKAQRGYPPFKHVIYIIKENRTYDQVFGDVADGDGDPKLLFFGNDCSSNHRALAQRFGLFDHFFTNAEVSSQGHLWSTAATVTDYSERLIPSLYADKRAEVDEGDVDEPTNGFLWQAATKAGITFRDYGEWINPPANGKPMSPARPGLEQHVCPSYPPLDMTIPDQKRADAWIAELQMFERKGEMPRLEILHLPADHTAAGKANMPTPRACMADNDLALGRIIDALSRSRFWKDSVVFVLEDDAQAGPDHIDSHRSVLLVISPYSRRGTIKRFVNTTDVVAAIEDILGLQRLSQYDYFSRPLTHLFSKKPDFTAYSAIKPAHSLTEKNPAQGPGSAESEQFDVTKPDAVDDAAFNRVLWTMLKPGTAPMPVPRYAAPIHLMRAPE